MTADGFSIENKISPLYFLRFSVNILSIKAKDNRYPEREEIRSRLARRLACK
jgi:hypothetical protein